MASEQINPFCVVKGDVRGCVQRTDTEGHGPHCCGGGMAGMAIPVGGGYD